MGKVLAHDFVNYIAHFTVVVTASEDTDMTSDEIRGEALSLLGQGHGSFTFEAEEA